MMLTGGTEASIDELSIAGFARMRALGLLPSNDHHVDKNDSNERGNHNRKNSNDVSKNSSDDNGDGDKIIMTSENDEKEFQRTSCPFHVNRNGFVIGEGAGILVLEELSSALDRGARIIAEVCGYGLSGDAFNATMPSTDGDGAARSMISAMNDANISPHQVSYINAHATSTPIGDLVEVNAIKKVFNIGFISTSSSPSSVETEASSSTRTSLQPSSPPPLQKQHIPPSSSSSSQPSPLYVSSTKGATGHLLGAAGAVETIFTAWSVFTGIIPPTLHLTKIDPELEGRHIFSHVPMKSIDYNQHHHVYEYHNDNHGLRYKNCNNHEGISQNNQGNYDAKMNDRNLNFSRKRYLYAINNSFGFGGTNASLVIGKYPISNNDV